MFSDNTADRYPDNISFVKAYTSVFRVGKPSKEDPCVTSLSHLSDHFLRPEPVVY